MRECSNCGASVREGAKFCTACGTRLNDVAAPTQLNSWALADSDATVVAAAVTPPASADETPSSEPDPAPEAASTTGDAGGFSWSWQSSDAAEESAAEKEEGAPGDDGSSPPPLDDDDEGQEASDTPESVDAAEAEVLADEPDSSDEESATLAADDPEPVADQSTPEAQDTVDGDDDATLAAWAGQWSDEDDATTTEPDEVVDEGGTVIAITRNESADEDPAARAEWLLDELKRIIPSLSQPRVLEPGATAEGNTALLGGAIPAGLLDDLAEADDDQSFDDVRETIEAARANPRDVDSMLKLASNAERLKLLIDDRDRLAGKLTDIRNRLSAQVPEPDAVDEA